MPPKKKTTAITKRASSFVDASSVIERADGCLQLRFHSCNVSFVNAIRRTLLTDIPVAGFVTMPHDKCKAVFLMNTSHIHNEELKQRLSTIPIHYSFPDPEILSQYMVECNVQNTTSEIIYVTTKDFRIVRKDGRAVESAANFPTRDELFPANPYSNMYIDVVALRPQINKDIPGDRLHFTAEMSVVTVRNEGGMYNAVSESSYGYTVDTDAQKEVLERKVQEWTEENPDITPEELEFQRRDWLALEGQRIVVPNSFDFSVESVGIYTNEELLAESCRILVGKLRALLQDHGQMMKFLPSQSTIPHCFDIRLEHEDHTIGKILEYCLYNGFFMNAKTLSFVAFVKDHPHDEHSTIRVAYKENMDAEERHVPDTVFRMQAQRDVQKCLHDSVEVFEDILLAFR